MSESVVHHQLSLVGQVCHYPKPNRVVIKEKVQLSKSFEQLDKLIAAVP